MKIGSPEHIWNLHGEESSLAIIFFGAHLAIPLEFPFDLFVFLIDGQRLTELMIEYNVGVRTNRSIEFKRVDEDFFSDEG